MDFSTLYFDEPDTTGHGYGPLSIEYKNKVYKKLLLVLLKLLPKLNLHTKKIKELDIVLGYLINKLNEAKILEKLNIIIVSDHG